LPWNLYQKLWDPPGNRLLKIYLAGVWGIDNRTTWQALKDFYGGLSASQIAAHKLSNVYATLPDKEMLGSLALWRWNEFFRLVPALGALNFGWLVLALSFFKRTGEISRAPPRIYLGVGLLSCLIWILLVYGGGQTVVHQGSYACMVLLFAGLISLLYTLPRALLAAIVALHICDFLVVWVFTTPASWTLPRAAAAANYPMICLSALALAGIIAIVLMMRCGEERGPSHAR
jgi:hypothetical protein